MSGKDLDFSKWFGRSGNPKFLISKARMTEQLKLAMENGQTNGEGEFPVNEWLKVHETEFYKGTKNCHFNTIKISASKLCSGDYNLPLKVEFYNHKTSGGDHKYKGEVHFNLNTLLNLKQDTFTFKSKRKNGKECGILKIHEIKTVPNHSFSEYLAGGLNIQCLICIDYTASNKNPFDKDSLHNINPHELNPYQQAIVSVSQILLNYDTDKKIPTYGFGGVPKFPRP